MTCDNYCL